MYLKIIRRSLYNFRDSYLIYILSCSFAITVLSVLATIVDDPSLQMVRNWHANLKSLMQGMMFIFAFFTFIYMIYVGGFFVKQQRQEFMTYEKLGMSRHIVAVIAFIQTFIVQIVAWLIGMLVAVILQKFFGMLLVYLMHVRMEFRFHFSMVAFHMMFQFFITSALIFSLVNALRVYWMQRKNSKRTRLHLNDFCKSLLGILGAMLFLIGMFVSIPLIQESKQTNVLDEILPGVMVVMLLFLVGSYLIYYGFLPLVLKILEKIKTFSYRGTNLFAYKYLRKRLVQNTSIIWFVTELSALALTILIFCFMGYQIVHSDYSNSYPFEISANQNTAKKIRNELNSNGSKVKKEYSSPVKKTIGQIYNQNTGDYEQRLVMAMPYSSYQNMPKRIRKNNPKINSHQFLEIRGNPQTLYTKYRDAKSSVIIQNQQTINKVKIGAFYPFGSAMFSEIAMVVPDAYFAKLPTKFSDTFYGWDFHGSDKLSHKFIKKIDKKNNPNSIRVKVGSNIEKSSLQEIPNSEDRDWHTNEYNQVPYVRQANARIQIRQLTGIFIFLIFIFSIALLIALGSLLTLKVLLKDDYEWRQLKTLKKVGLTENELKQIVRRETSFLFTIPIIFALAQSVIAAIVINVALKQSSLLSFGMIGLAYIALYGLVGILTFHLSWRSVKQRIS
ncbi:ABC transporter permease [Companilactobacillus mishanensis]|uniref:ABC transporter permease n=1 Tax=Companilactobacillus mishanensis TaxID=2486008 RepID=UPI001297A81C|nr:FtsX-like permease family protein [Companilactobacillus mishanensis]MQS89020.1 hypothetical protein [Companilactobacillus mishanensis]